MAGLRVKFQNTKKMKVVDGETFIPFSYLRLHAEALQHYAEYMEHLEESAKRPQSKLTFKFRKEMAMEECRVMKDAIGYCEQCNIKKKDISTGYDGFSAGALGSDINNRE